MASVCTRLPWANEGTLCVALCGSRAMPQRTSVGIKTSGGGSATSPSEPVPCMGWSKPIWARDDKCVRCGKTVYEFEKAVARAHQVSRMACVTGPRACVTGPRRACVTGPRWSSRIQLAHTPFLARSVPASGTHVWSSCDLRCGVRISISSRLRQGDKADIQSYHRSCFRCADCNRGPLRPDDWEIDLASGELLCRVHFAARQHASGPTVEIA